MYTDMPNNDYPLWVPRRPDKTNRGERGIREGAVTLQAGLRKKEGSQFMLHRPGARNHDWGGEGHFGN